MTRRWKLIFSVLLLSLFLISCGKSENVLVSYSISETDEYATIVYNDKVFVPYCVVSKQDCGEKIGIIEGDEKHYVYTYKNLSSDEWVIDLLDTGLMDNPMLWREINVTEVPDGLKSEYEWNDFTKNTLIEDEWGISLEVKDVTGTGLTLVIKQSGGNATGELQFGEEYYLEQLKDGQWTNVETSGTGDITWNELAYIVKMDGSTEQKLNWQYFYGSLSEGKYRLTKSIIDFRGTGDYDTKDYNVEFEITSVQVDKQSSVDITKKFFDAFATSDYETMKDYCTSDCIEKYFHANDVNGMVWAKISETGQEESGEDGRLYIYVTVEMETSENSALYPDTETSFYLELQKQENEELLINSFSTGK